MKPYKPKSAHGAAGLKKDKEKWGGGALSSRVIPQIKIKDRAVRISINQIIYEI